MEEQSARLQGQFACLSDSKPKTATPFPVNNSYFLGEKGVGLPVSDLYDLYKNWCYVEVSTALTPSPSPAGEGNKKITVLLPSPAGEGLGVRAVETST